jgi:hypothetical protein
MTLSKDKVPTKKNVRDIIGTFLTEEWLSMDPETLTVLYYVSFVNAHCPVERPKPATGTPTKALKVFIKFHNDTEGSLEIFKPLAPTKHKEETPVTIAPNPLKTLILSIAIALRRRRKVFGSSLLTIKIFITTHARYVIAPPRRTIAIYTLSIDLDRTL